MDRRGLLKNGIVAFFASLLPMRSGWAASTDPTTLILEAEKHLPYRLFFHHQDGKVCWDFSKGKAPAWAMLYTCVGAKLVDGAFTSFGKCYGKFYTVWFQVTDAASIDDAVNSFWRKAERQIIQDGYRMDNLDAHAKNA